VLPSPPQLHRLIFQTFDGLHAAHAFLPVNDHNSKPLYCAFKAERDGHFDSDYLEQGPEMWRVRIGRVT
jgi:uncharacterized protein (DUF2249 family)